MEAVSIYSLILIISVSAIAFLIGRLTSKGREDNMRLEKELEQSRKEFKDYRSQVTSHFQETAHRVNALTENYRNVYEHLARGAQELCDKSDAPLLMNELNRNPMLGGETIESPEVEHEVVSAETDAGIDSEPDSAVGKTDEIQEKTMDSTNSENLDDPIGEETDQNTQTDRKNGENTNKVNDIASDQTTCSDKNINDKHN
jgi:uncharacterized membrane-anchored protein YhcB (DUF1043 family)